MTIKALKNLSFMFFVSVLCQFAFASETQSRTYELDMFSLISFGLAIAALVLSIFMAWLSWQFYVKSDPLREYRTPKKLSKLTPEVIHEQETNPKREQEVYN